MDGKTIKELIDNYTSTNIYQQMKLYYDLYMKRNPNLMERIRQRELKRRTPNWCVPTAYFSTVIDTHAGYLFSNVQYDCENDEYEAHLQEILDANNVSVKDMKAGLNALTFNRAYELVYTVGDGENLKGTQIKFASLDPLSVVPIYSDTIEPEIIAAVWFRESSNGAKLADYITATEWTQFRAEKDKEDYTQIGTRELTFSQCPVVEYRAEMIGDVSPFDSVVSYIEALDWAITGNSNEIDRIVDAILLLGKKLSPDDRDHLNEIKTIEDISKDEITPQFLEKNLSPEFRKYVTDLLIQEIYRHSHTVDWHTQMEGEASAKALKIKLFDMDMYSKRIEKVFIEGTKKRLDLIMELVRLRDNMQPEAISVSFERTLPTDNETLIQVLTGVDWISNQTKQEWVGLNSDIEQERLSGEAPMINLDDIPSEESGNMVDSE
jgi:SPP1 family phage portal protein